MSEDNLPDRRKHGYQQLEQQLDQHAAVISARFKRLSKGLILAFAIVGLACTIALIGFGLLLREQSRQTDRLEHLSRANRRLTLAIQKQRFDNLKSGCEDQNQRNDSVNNKIDDAIANLPPQKQGEAEAKSRPFRLIITAAVPYIPDCDAYARERVKGHD